MPTLCKDPSLAANYHPISLLSLCYKLLERLALHRVSPTVEGYSVQTRLVSSSLKWPYLRTRSSMVVRYRTLVHLSVWLTYRVDELFAPQTLAATVQLVHHWRQSLSCCWSPSLEQYATGGHISAITGHLSQASEDSSVHAPCHIRTHNYRN